MTKQSDGRVRELLPLRYERMAGDTVFVPLLTGCEPTDPSWVEQHADGMVATLLPRLALASGRPTSP